MSIHRKRNNLYLFSFLFFSLPLSAILLFGVSVIKTKSQCSPSVRGSTLIETAHPGQAPE